MDFNYLSSGHHLRTNFNDGLDRVRSENRKIGRTPFGYFKDPNKKKAIVKLPEQV